MSVVISDQILFHHRHSLPGSQPGITVVVQHIRVWYRNDSCFRVEEVSSSNDVFIYVSHGDQFVVYVNGNTIKDPNGNIMSRSPHNLPPYVRAACNPDLLHAGYSVLSSETVEQSGLLMTIKHYRSLPDAGVGADLAGPFLTISSTQDNELVYWIEELGGGEVTIGHQMRRSVENVGDNFPWQSRASLLPRGVNEER